MGKLILTRSRHLATRLWVFQIVIDGRPTASISAGQTAVIDLPAGHHDVVARVDWWRSRPLRIKVIPRGKNYAEVGSAITPWYWLLTFASGVAWAHWHNTILSFALLLICLAPLILFRDHIVYLTTITASEAAARRGMRIPHPDALPAIRLSPELFGKW